MIEPVTITQMVNEKRFVVIFFGEEAWRVLYKKWYGKLFCEMQRCSSQKQLETLVSEHERKKARGYVYQLLALRGYMKSALREKLERRKVTPSVIEEVLEECERRGYVDEEREALAYIEYGLRKGWGPALLEYKLRPKLEGIDVRPFVRDHFSKSSQREVIARLIEKKYSGLLLSDRLVKQKIFRFLKGRGFDDALICEFLFAD